MGFLDRAKSRFAELKGEPFSRDSSHTHGLVPVDMDDEENRGISRGLDEEQIFDLIRVSPEALSLMQAIVDDVIGGEEPRFEYLGDTSGERATQQARRFWKMKAKEIVADALMDCLAIGDGYVYKQMLTEEEVRSELEQKYAGHFNLPGMNRLAAKELTEELKSDRGHYEKASLKAGQDIFKPSDVKMVPASTVTHVIDKHGNVKFFHQEVGTNETEIDPRKMIHFDYMTLDGRTYGFTPLRSIVTELTMLANAKDHNGKKFENAGVMNKLVKLVDEGPDSKNYQLIKQTVKKFREDANKYKDWVVTGDVEVEDLDTIGQNMAFRELAEYVTRVTVMAWGVPPTRVGMSISGESGARVTSLTHQGYFRRIKRLQSKLETDLNKDLFEPHFNCHMHLKEPDIQTAIKKADRDLRKTDVAVKRMAAGMWDRDEAKKYLDIEDFQAMDMEDEKDQALMSLAAQIASGRDQQLSELEVFGGRAEEEMAEDQRQATEEE